MAIEITWDRLIGTELESALDGGRFARGGFVKGVVGDDYSVLFAIQNHPDVPKKGTPLPEDATLPPGQQRVVSRIIVRPLGGNTYRIQAVYEVPRGGSYVANSVFVRLSDRTERYQTTYFPGTRRLIRMPAKRRAAIGVLNGILLPGQIATVELQRTITQAQVTMIASGDPNYSAPRYTNYVNDAPWLGLPKGYWLVSAWNIEQDVLGGTYRLDVVADTKTIEDWSVTETLRDALTGALSPEIEDDDIEASQLPGYSHGVIFNQPETGVLRIGPHPAANFDDIFGPLAA